MKTLLKVLLPLLALALGFGAFKGISSLRKDPASAPPQALPPLVRTQTLVADDVVLRVRAQGSVRPRTESALVSEVSGRIVSVSPDFVEGGFFEAGQTLLEIDPADYRQALASAKAQLAQAELALAQEEAQADIARKEWDSLGKGEEASPLTLREPQVAQARANVEAAAAQVERAERDLARTRVSAPFAGRIRAKNADVGQFVNRGSVLAQIYSIDVAEVRLPVPDDELAFLDLPLSYRDDASAGSQPEARISGVFAGERHEWPARVVRTEAEIDPQSRVVNLVAEVRNPYRRKGERPPLSVGMFVDADILGRTVENALVVPRAAFRDPDTVMVVGDDERLTLRDVEVVRAGRDEVVVRSGLESGERVCISPLDTVTDGMRVRSVAENQGEQR